MGEGGKEEEDSLVIKITVELDRKVDRRVYLHVEKMLGFDFNVFKSRR